MTSPPVTPPKRRRRRWLIVALLLVLASGVAWWQWPRGDARFVGKWAAIGRGEQFAEFVFHKNGTGFDTVDEDQVWFAWKVVDNQLTTSRPSLPIFFSMWMKRRSVALGSRSYAMTITMSAEQPEIVLRDLSDDGATQFYLQRIPE